MPSTKSKNIIITGGARGIGRCTARHLLSLPVSHRVFIIDFDADELEYTVNTHHRSPTSAIRKKFAAQSPKPPNFSVVG
jgi:NAD(P)-dependent dehydrogenase (short-subunit alcohol dehydrogenase family)